MTGPKEASSVAAAGSIGSERKEKKMDMGALRGNRKNGDFLVVDFLFN